MKLMQAVDITISKKCGINRLHQLHVPGDPEDKALQTSALAENLALILSGAEGHNGSIFIYL